MKIFIKPLAIITAIFLCTYGIANAGVFLFEGDLIELGEQNLGARSVLSVKQGGTGASTFTSGECLVGNGTGAITTQACGGASGGGSSIWSTTTPDLILYYNGSKPIVIGSNATGTPNTKFEVLGNVSFGTIASGTWNGEIIGDAYLTKTGDWTGTLDGYEASELLGGSGATDMLSQIGDVSTSTLAFGHLLMWDGSNWQDTATSSLGIASGGTFYYETATSTESQTVFDISTFTYTVGGNQLDVYVNGVYQLIYDSYNETDNNTITFLTGLNTGDRVVFAVRGGSTPASGTQLTEEEVEDYIGGMVTGNTETNITVTYQDDDGTLDFVATGGTGWTFASTTLDYWFDNTSGITRLSPYMTQAYASSTYQLLDDTLTDIADGTITENLVNTANPWADNEVSDTLTVTGYMQDTDIDTFAELQAWAVGYTDNNTTYTAGDALTLTGTDFDFDGGATPGGDLGGTWASPSVDDDSHNHVYSNIDAFTEANLYTLLTDVAQFYEPSDNISVGNATSTGVMDITDGTNGVRIIPGATTTLEFY